MRKTVRPALIAVVALSLAGCLKPGKINLGSSESHESHGGKQASVAATPAKTVVQQTKQSLDPATQEQINAAVMSMLASGQTTP
ncbi:MAG: hypothetical protein HWD59_10180 [Coxiellaceae bacterium]|nr:MAG: hypothetical protein HWD59_10180 [Coxiellaceae bacterium]